MVDPWESIDLTMTCDSDGEASLAPGGEPVVNIRRLPVDVELCRTPAKILPSLAQRFTEIYSGKCSNNSQERSSSQEGISSLCQNTGTQRSKSPGDPKPNLTVDSTFNIPISFNNDLPEGKRTKLRPAFEFDSREKTGLQFEEEVIEIADDSNDQTANDAPVHVVVSSDNETCHSDMEIEDFAITESDHWEEVDVNYHNADPPELLTESPNPNMLSPGPLLISPEPHISSQVPSPKPFLVHGQVDIPLFGKIQGINLPQCNSLAVDKQADSDNESIISINSENESDNFLVQSPPSPVYYCMYCEYSTTVEECCLKHIAGHQPGTKPFLRLFCTECSLSAGSEKVLLFHMRETHHIMNPELYILGKELYTCSTCKLTQKLRTDIESHIYERHKVRDQVPLMSNDVKGGTRAMRFQCVEKGCARNCKSIYVLRNHIINNHKTAPLSYHEFVPREGKPSKHAMYGCFLCGFKGSDKRCVRLHAKMHYTSKKGPNVEDVTRLVTVGQTEEMDRKKHNQELKLAVPHDTSPGPRVTSPGHNEKSPNPHRNSSYPDPYPVFKTTSSEPNFVTPVPHTTSPEPDFVDDEQLIDMPEHDNESPPPPYDSYTDEEEVENDNESSDSDYNYENRQGQPRTFYCIYCEYTTVIEEWYHKHIASHLPGTKPYFRMYCTECSYSTGSEKYLLFHMSHTHRIVNPEFYRSGEKRYTCRICRHTLELRIDIESHIKVKHKPTHTRAKESRDMNVIYQCSEEECEKCYKNLKCLRSHVQKHHNIRFPSYYYERTQATGELKLTCFSCKKTIEKKIKTPHAKMHYSNKQRRAPYLYFCPVPLKNSKCPFSCKKRSEISEHYQSVHFKNLKYYKNRECTYACLNCPYIVSSVLQMKNHCTSSCKNRLV